MARTEEFMGVSAADRLGMTLFFAAVLHAAIVLGISFDLQPRPPAAQTVEVTLAQQEDEEEPDKADFLAQANQQGSGTLEEVRDLATPSPTSQGVEPQEQTAQQEVTEQRSAAAAPEPQQVVSQTPAESRRPVSETEEESHVAEPRKRQTLMQKSLEIASLEARFLEQRQAYAKRPRVTRLTAVSARKTSSAFYMDAWRKKLERIGNLNYPEEARRRQLQGRVRVLVSLSPDGSVTDIEILESSRHKILDDAVIRIIRLAEPFAPFTDQMRKEMDRLEIIRTFDFGSRLSSF